MNYVPSETVNLHDCRSNTDGKCFYCTARIGEQHDSECVVRVRSVVARVTIDIVLDEPQSWDLDFITNRYENGSWCQSNIVSYLNRLDAARERNGRGCLCGIVHIEAIRDATEEDEAEGVANREERQ